MTTQATHLRSLRCRDGGAECDFEVRAATDEEILDAAEVHAVRRHGMQWSPELAAAVTGLIRTVGI